MSIIQESAGIDPRGRIEFDEYERNAYVSRFLDVFNADISEREICIRAYAIHQEICNNHDLYIAVAERLQPVHRRALHEYAQRRGEMPSPESFCSKRLCDGEPCMLVSDHKGECRPLPI